MFLLFTCFSVFWVIFYRLLVHNVLPKVSNPFPDSIDNFIFVILDQPINIIVWGFQLKLFKFYVTAFLDQGCAN